MKTARRFAVVAFAATLASAQAPYAFHFEFDHPGVLPDATPGVLAFNPTGSPTTTLFNAACGVLHQNMTLNPNSGAGFYGGTFGAYPGAGPGMTAGAPSFIEASFRLTGGFGGPGTIPNATGVMGMFPGASVQLLVNVVTGDVGIVTFTGPFWVTPPGTAFTRHTYRLQSYVLLGITHVDLNVDGGLFFGGVTVPWTSSADGFFFGDGAGSSSIAADLEWDYVSVGQTAQGPGQRNSVEASLFVNRSNTTHKGQQGLKGPFNTVVAPGSTVTLDWNGPAFAPFVLMAGPQNPANSNFGCIGSLDVATPPGYSDLSILFDPFNPIVGALFHLDACGKASQTFSVPWLAPFTPLANFQGGVFQPSGCALVLTAAHYVST